MENEKIIGIKGKVSKDDVLVEFSFITYTTDSGERQADQTQSIVIGRQSSTKKNKQAVSKYYINSE